MEPSRGGDPGTITLLLERVRGGDQSALEELWPLVYDELRRLADGRVARADRGTPTLEPTAVVHEAWLRLARQGELRAEGREQFFALAGRVVRSVLVDAARARAAGKRGGGARQVTLVAEAAADGQPPVDVLALDEALERLEASHADAARLVELRFFAGLSHAEIASALGSSVRSVERTWRFARAWLLRELSV